MWMQGYNIPIPGSQFTPHLAQPSLKQRPVINRSTGHAKTNKKTTQKWLIRIGLVVAWHPLLRAQSIGRGLSPAGLRRFRGHGVIALQWPLSEFSIRGLRKSASINLEGE